MAQSPRPLILAYHAVSSSWKSPLAISEPRLRAQLTYLRRRGYVGLTFAEAERRRRDASLPDRTVVMTFDDGYASTLRALPLLEECGFAATVFVVTGFTESQAPLSWFGIEQDIDPITAEELRPLGWDDLSRLVERGWEVGSHTVTHPLLIDLDEDALRSEIACSRLEIVKRLGDCKTLAYPYGVADVRVAGFAKAAGYFGACVLTGAHFTDDSYRRPRVGLTNADAGWRLRVKLSPASLALRRSGTALMVRRLRRHRAWQPPRVAGR